MARQIELLFFGSDSLNTTEFQAFINLSTAPMARRERIIETERLGQYPNISRTQPEGHQLIVRVNVKGGAIAYDVQEEVSEIFTPGRTATLSAEWGTDTESDIRTIAATVQQIAPLETAPNTFTVTLRTPNPGWRGPYEVTNGTDNIAITAAIQTDVTRETAADGDGLLSPVGFTGMWRGTTNLITNGGFETNTTGWSTVGSNTISASTDYAKFGDQSLKATYTGGTASIFLASGALTFPGAGNYVISAWFRAEEWDGGDLRVDLTGYSGSTAGEEQTAGIALRLGEWVLAWKQITVTGGGLSGFPVLYAGSAPTNPSTVYIDGVQVEAGDFPTPYVETDGGTAARADGYISPATSGRFDETEGWFAIKFRAGWSSLFADVDRSFLFWGDANNHLSLWYDESAGQFKFTRANGGSATTVAVTQSTTLDGYVVVAIDWSATELRMSVNESAFTTQANTDIPDLSAFDTLNLGYDDVNSLFADMSMVWAEYGAGTITSGLLEAFNTPPTSKNLLVVSESPSLNAWEKRGVTVEENVAKGKTGKNLHRLTWGGKSTDRVLQVLRDPEDPTQYYSTPPSLIFQASVEMRGEFNGQQVKLVIADDSSDGSDETEKIITLTTDEEVYSVTHTIGAGRVGYAAFSIENVGSATGSLLYGAPTVQDVTNVPNPKVNISPKIKPGFSGVNTGPGFGTLGASGRSQIDPNVIQNPPGGGGGTSGESFVMTVTNNGNAKVSDAIILFDPKQNKSTANYWNLAQHIVVANRSEEAFTDYALEVVDDTLNHASRVSGGQSLASGKDLRIVVDGKFEPWYPNDATDINTNDLALWININLSPRKVFTLRDDITASAPSNEEKLYTARGDTAGWPGSGVILLNDEVIFYEGKGVDYFLVSQRGQRGSTAAIHTAGDVGYWIEHQIWLLYANYADAVDTYVEAPERAPMFDLAQSSNTKHVYSEFFHDTDPRSRQWVRTLDPEADTQANRVLAPGGSPAASLGFEYDRKGAKPGKPNFNQWSLSIPGGTRKKADGDTAAEFTATSNTGMMGAVASGTSSDGQRVELAYIHNQAATPNDDNIIMSNNFETGTEDWTANSDNTAEIVSDSYFTGSQCLKATYQGTSKIVGGWNGVVLSGAVAHVITVWVRRGDNDLDPGTVNLLTAGYTSATTPTANNTKLFGVTAFNNRWFRLDYYITPDAADLTGNVYLEFTGAGTVTGASILVDGFMIQTAARASSYYDTARCIPAQTDSVYSLEFYGRSLCTAGPSITSLKETDYDLQNDFVEFDWQSSTDQSSVYGALLRVRNADLDTATYMEGIRLALGYKDADDPPGVVELSFNSKTRENVLPAIGSDDWYFFPAMGPDSTSLEVKTSQTYYARWIGGEDSYNGAGPYAELFAVTFPSPPLFDGTEYPQGYILSFDMDHTADVAAQDGSNLTMDAMSLYYDSSTVPYVSRNTSNSNRYVVDLAITNQATSQTLELFAVLEEDKDNTIAIDIGKRVVTAPQSLEPNKSRLVGFTASDPDRWLDLVPGDNDIFISDTGANDFNMRFFFAPAYV